MVFIFSRQPLHIYKQKWAALQLRSLQKKLIWFFYGILIYEMIPDVRDDQRVCEDGVVAVTREWFDAAVIRLKNECPARLNISTQFFQLQLDFVVLSLQPTLFSFQNC